MVVVEDQLVMGSMVKRKYSHILVFARMGSSGSVCTIRKSRREKRNFSGIVKTHTDMCRGSERSHLDVGGCICKLKFMKRKDDGGSPLRELVGIIIEVSINRKGEFPNVKMNDQTYLTILSYNQLQKS